ncbi:MAG: Lin0512 family protein [Deltaproteobacteria bacterium]|nr:Lin0512 family protein [Deltaproteobacteria bacterium]
MDKKRFIVELGTGADLHGENVTEAACRAVKDAISKSCLCGLAEILNLKNFKEIDIEILVACPKPEQVDLEKVKAVVPIGRKTAQAVLGGMQTRGLCVPMFGPECDQIMVANASITVWVNP